MKKKLLSILFIILSLLTITSCSMLGSSINDIKGQLIGNAFNCYFYDNYGEKFLTTSGTKIGLESNIVKDGYVTSDGNYDIQYTMSSVITINIDGKQIQSCGDTVIFEEKGLDSEVNFTLTDIQSSSSGSITDNTIISNTINKYKNYFGKSSIVVIQSQLGVPICAYSGDDVYWEVRNDLPKTTKLMIDGKALYIHRANFQIIDKALLK